MPYTVSSCGKEGVFLVVEGHCTNGLLVLSEGFYSFSHSEVPELDGLIVRASDDLGVEILGNDGRNGV